LLVSWLEVQVREGIYLERRVEEEKEEDRMGRVRVSVGKCWSNDNASYK
jgi:hypothetical protein